MFAAKDTLLTRPSGAAYEISRSLRFNSADSAYLNRTPASASNRTTWTWSAWVKRSILGGDQALFARSSTSGSEHTGIKFDSDCLRIFSDNSAPYHTDITSTQVFRDPSAWYHIVVALDTTQATSTNRLKMYVNGLQITSFSTTQYPAQNSTPQINTANPHGIGRYLEFSGNWYLDGYMTEVNFIDGQALTPSSFGSTNADTGVWQPKAFSGTYGTNGFYLNFSDNSNTTAATLGKDYSGNGNNWTPNNFSVSAGAGNDSLVDSPTSYGTDTGVGGSVRGNYSTWNPINSSSSSNTFVNGNLDASVYNGTSNVVVGTIAVSSGKWYWEVTPYFSTGSGDYMIGVSDATSAITSSCWTTANAWAFSSNGSKYTNTTGTAYGSTYTTNDVIGVALDMDAGTLVFYKNGTSQGTAYSVFSGKTIVPMGGNGAGATAQYYTCNFGQRPFAYTAPSGYKALCTQNLPTPTIGATTATQAGKYFNPVLYTGTGSSLSVTGVGFQPDWVWVKGRSGAASNGLYDAVRGVQKQLISNLTAAETTETTGLTALGSDGFTVGALAQLNTSAATYVAWNWKANGAGSSNTAGSITSTVSANTTSGFSVVTYTGSGVAGTIGHGLGVAPSVVIVKSRSATGDWPVYHVSFGNSAYFLLNTFGASTSSSSIWNATSPTSSVFSVGINTTSNTVTTTYVAYCFAPIAGYSAFGTYAGNATPTTTNASQFIYTGFKPRWVLVKLNQSGHWTLFDSARSPYNTENLALRPSSTDAEINTGSPGINALSNGFQLYGDYNYDTNGTSYTYIYIAFAETPFKYSLAR